MNYIIIKRLFDIVFGLIGTILIMPISLLIKIVFLCSGDTGRIMYHQDRVGKDGRIFKMKKYRSMVQNADQMLEGLLKDERYRREWELNQKIEDDPRITKIGKLLRKTSLDELPLFWNVLIGDMSIVGPRPLVEGELEAHGGSKLYWKVKPGITGWWACHGRSNLSYKERLALEYYYVEHCSLWLDIRCLIKTIIAVQKTEGAV